MKNEKKTLQVCVYCGASRQVDDSFKAFAYSLGALLARSGFGVIYGGGSTGLMGAVARGAVENGGRVTGVIPEFLFEVEVGYEGVSELLRVETMHERKMTMFERADAFVVIPGGFGTLEELFEVLTWKQLGQHNKPIIVANLSGYWEPLRQLLHNMRDKGFVRPENLSLLAWTESAEESVKVLEQLRMELAR